MNISQMLKDEGLISDEQHQFILDKERKTSFSIYWELRVFLYLGVVLLSTGFGMLIYENIDTIGHVTIIAIIFLLCAGCFWYSWKFKKPFTFQFVESPNAIYDYILLLGCLLFLTLEGYLQYQYNLFGQKWGLATIVPTLFFFFIAYYFDHKAVLGMAISGLALWLGIAITPFSAFDTNQFDNIELVCSGIGLGVVLLLIAWQSVKENIKKHFEFTYLNFGLHLVFIAAIVGMMSFEYKWAFILIIVLFCYHFIKYSRDHQSFYFLLAATFYGYFTLTYLFLLAVDEFNIGIEVIFLYFILSCAFIIFFFLNYKKFLNPVK